LNSEKIRETFLDYFKGKDHKIVTSASLIPYEDPTLLFTNAGMNQFKDVFLNTGSRDYKRAVDIQKCIRAGGKHNDLEEVGLDGYHHTFFEMLGNWSFGDYYKKEAIIWAWDLLTNVFKLPKSKLWATVYKTDIESENIWKTETDISEDHILRFDEKDNFWEMGETGPCGPCSEIHIDLSVNGCKPEDINAGLEDVIEIWNLVFIQYNRNAEKELIPLPKKHVDTGMGFERIVRVLQNKKSNYETDLFQPIIKKISDITGKEYKGNNVSVINAISDHIRALTFAITDGAFPSNEGRGYVLRRILRRADRLARLLDYKEPLLYKLADEVIDKFSSIYPELEEKRDSTKSIIKNEEESFNITLDKGIEIFNKVIEELTLNNKTIFPGDQAFKLYDTYGFPIDMTEIMSREKGFSLDLEKFNEEMKIQKERSREARKNIITELNHFPASNNNVKYDPYHSEKPIKTKIFKYNNVNGNSIIVLKENPFFSESGGQISDKGRLIFPDGTELNVLDSKKSYIIADKINKEIEPEIEVTAEIDLNRRKMIEINHSATHLLHESLIRILGNQIKQMGSLVSDEYLRFDFPAFGKLSEEQIFQSQRPINSPE
jgi:alanyl-tRNA synthetase